MYRFIETIRIENGKVWNADEHNRRMNATRRAVWGDVPCLRVEDYIAAEPYGERTRCRLLYGRQVESVEYFPYHVRPVNRLKLVASDEIDYTFKSADRSPLDALFACRGKADDVLIVRHGLLTDTSIANVALYDGVAWYTPSRPLLKGTHRASLLRQGVLREADIPASDWSPWRKIRLFNAMISFGEVELMLPDAVLP